MFVYRLKNFICVAVAVSFSLFCMVGVKSVQVTKLAELVGERTYFLDSPSSQGLRKKQLSFGDLTRVKGECVSTSISAYNGGRYLTKEDLAEEIALKYGAEILFCEETDGVVSYYAYTDAWRDELYLYGTKINLHIALDGERLTVGTPIIFDGF